jgi:D-alanine-D-alanine ligase
MLNLALIYGGQSSEHSVSCVTALGVLSAVDTAKYRVLHIGITKSGKFVQHQIQADWKLSQYPEVLESAEPVSFLPGSNSVRLASGEDVKIDIAFPVLHGPNGEDGSVQGLLQLMGVPYVGNGVLASSLAMEKSKAKAVFRDAGIAVADELVIERSNWKLNKSEELAKAQQFSKGDVFVKPSRSGSSVGVTLVHNSDDLVAAIDLALSLDQTALVEQRVFGREVECSVLEKPNGELVVSLAGEIVVTGREFYDYEAKYLDGGAELKVPTELKAQELAEMHELAIAAFRALGCSGLARTDFFLTENGFLLTEVNTMPGFTPISMYASMFAVSGVSYPELVETLIQTGLAKGTDPR